MLTKVSYMIQIQTKQDIDTQKSFHGPELKGKENRYTFSEVLYLNSGFCM